MQMFEQKLQSVMYMPNMFPNFRRKVWEQRKSLLQIVNFVYSIFVKCKTLKGQYQVTRTAKRFFVVVTFEAKKYSRKELGEITIKKFRFVFVTLSL
jgi:hypothetical protein